MALGWCKRIGHNNYCYQSDISYKVKMESKYINFFS